MISIPPAPPWRIAADTGGTFTDCHALDPQGRESRCKVLSTGHLRASLFSSMGFLARVSGLPPLPSDFLIGFKVQAVGDNNSLTITSWNSETSEITLNQEPTWPVGALLELETFSGRINSDFPLTLQPGETGGRRGRRMEFTIGNGGARVTAQAFSGNINIRRGTTTTDRE